MGVVIQAVRHVVGVHFVGDVGPAVGGGWVDSIEAEECLHDDQVVGVDGSDGVIKPVVVGALGCDVAGRLAVAEDRFVHQVVAGYPGVPGVAGGHDGPDVVDPVLVGGVVPEFVGVQSFSPAAFPGIVTPGKGVQVEDDVDLSLRGLLNQPVDLVPGVGLPGSVVVEQCLPSNRQSNDVEAHGCDVVKIGGLDPAALEGVQETGCGACAEPGLVFGVHVVVVVIERDVQLVD